MGVRAGRAATVPGVRELLRAAFAQELGERLPRLAALAAGGPVDPDEVRRDAHTLASSAWVVDEPEIGRLARAVEEDLTGGPLPELVAALRAWAP